MKTFKIMLKINIAQFFMLLFFVNNIKAQTINKTLEEFLGTYVLPIEIGNVWNYRNGYFQPERKLTLIDTLNIDGRKYYLMKYVTSLGYTDAFQYVRLREDGFYVSRVLDSLLTFFPNEDYVYYKKNAQIGDTWNQSSEWDDTYYHIVLDSIEVSSFWGTFIPVKIVEVTDSSLTDYLEYWSEEFGLVQQQNADIGSGGWTLLWGCYVNGTRYGDTVLVSIDEKKPAQPTNFKLYQNYPNPFNPTTNIIYQIKERGLVQIKVHNILGNEIETLINEEKSEGRYSVNFNASNLPSGVYIYTLQVNDYTASKKMILLK
jgi:hypothetical protein